MAAVFHSRAGSLVTLSNGNKTAQRNHPAQEFNNGVVLSADPLKDNQLFEVRIDRKVNSWSGSIEIGVSTCDPNNLNFPTSATGFREGTWVMSGSSILKDGHSIIEEYGRDLDQLSEGDRVGVLRTATGVLHFFVNGMDQGPADSGIPSKIYAVIDMYGKCAQVTVVDDNNRDIVISNEITNEAIAEATYIHSNERLVFHERCGSLIKLSNNRRTAERRRPLDEFNNGVVMTNRPLKDDEMFEIRLDRLVDKWSGSIEVGITTHNPSTLDFPATMTNMRSGRTLEFAHSSTMKEGTIMMSGCGILTNGKGTRREYGEYNLDELVEGDRIGLMRKSNGTLHYYINGIDQGVAASRTPQVVWGVVDLYGMAVKVTILDRNDPNYTEPETIDRRANNVLRHFRDLYDNGEDENQEVEKLLFNPHCGSHAAVINGQRTGHRPNALDAFNNGVVLTNRALRPGEMFEVRLDRLVDKWAGSIEIGVTTHIPQELDFPSTMTNIRSGTWMMTGTGVMHNGTTVIDDYGQNLDRLKVGDRVGVIRHEDGTLNFFVNGIDQGPAATNVPPNVNGVIDLYGQAAQATIIDQTDPANLPDMEISPLADGDQLTFHSIHGRNSNISNAGRTASRPNARGEFNDAIVMSNRALRDNELFEVSIDNMVDRWSGSIEVGVTLIPPDRLDFPNTMTDIDYDTWMLSGSAVMQDGSTIRNGYPLDLDTLQLNSRVGMMRSADGTLHYFLNGNDMGVASTEIPEGIYAVIDLYGQCSQVSVTTGSGVRPADNHIMTADLDPILTSPISTDGDPSNLFEDFIGIKESKTNHNKGYSGQVESSHRFSQCCGKNIEIKNNGCHASRVRNFNNGLLFSTDPLRVEEFFEVRVDQMSKQWSGSLQVGLTTLAISDSSPVSSLPSAAHEIRSKVTWVVSGSEVKKNGLTIKENYAPSLERLEVGSRVGVMRWADATMHIYINGEDMGIAATNIPKNVFALIDLYGVVDAVTITSSAINDIILNHSRPPSVHSEQSETIEADADLDTTESTYLKFHCNHGKNVLLSNKNMTAERTASYNQGIVVTQQLLPRNQLFQVRIERLCPRWTASLVIGVIGFVTERYNFPVSAISLKKSAWVVQGDSVFHSGLKIKEHYGPDLNSLQVGHTVGVLVDDENWLHLYVNGVDQGPAARDVGPQCSVIIDLYGQCEQVTIVSEDGSTSEGQSQDYREKADIEDGMKEKMCRTPPSERLVVRNCEYQNMCARFKTTLGLPEGYFKPDLNVCYCETCHKIRGDDAYYKRGEPAREYALPFGWCSFGLRIQPKAHSLNVGEKWHLAYHGTRVDGVRRILDNNELIQMGDSRLGGMILAPRPNVRENRKPDSCDIKQICLSPTMKYAGLEVFAPKYEFKDPKTKKLHHARLGIQVCIKPGSYKIGPQTVGANEQIDGKFNNNEIEWSTKERGAIVLYSILIKVD